jgi:hypothetical protein
VRRSQYRSRTNQEARSKANWAELAQQIVEAFPWGTAPTYLVRDNDGAY